jgi:hypothetical protein
MCMKRFERSLPMPTRPLLVTLLAIACHGAMAQTETVSNVPAPLQVQRLAPQLVVFAGSDANFQSLVNGLAAGTQVQLVTPLSNGFSQAVTFTPAPLSSPLQIAQILESARQQLISLGIATPTAEQLGFVLMGGLVPTASGSTSVSGLVSGQPTVSGLPAANPPSRAAQIQQQSAAGATAPAAAPTTTPTAAPVTSAVNVQTTPTPTTTTTVTVPRQTSDSLTAAGATSRSAAPVTSASPAFTTSNSPAVNTSTSPTATTPILAPGPGVGAAPTGTERVPATARPARN